MQTYLHAYEAYENRLIRGEFTSCQRTRRTPFPLLMVIEAVLADLLISAGHRLKSHVTADRKMILSPLTGSKA